MNLQDYIRTWGADPEFFIMEPGGKIVSPHRVTTGTKERPENLFGGWAVQADGFALEINTPVFRTFYALQKEVHKFLKEKLPRFLRDRYGSELRLSRKLVATIPEDTWDDTPDTLKELGCSPDFNAYGTQPLPDASMMNERRLRTTGGHIAFGWHSNGKVTPKDVCCEVFHRTRLADLGGLNTSSFWSSGAEDKRRRYYGHVGSFRPTKFGMEMRQTSNAWCFTFDPYGRLSTELYCKMEINGR